MAKKKIKKPVSKRIKKTDAPKTRNPRAQKPEAVITTEPAINTVWREGSAAEFLGDTDPQVVSQVVSKVVSWTPPAPELPKSGSTPLIPIDVEWTKSSKYGWTDAAHEVYDDFISKFKKKDCISEIQEFAFAHPLLFGIAFSTAVLIVVMGFGIAARIFGW